jgi:hypothetical protein
MDPNTLIQCCEQKLIRSSNIDGRWAIFLVEHDFPQGVAIVREVKGGRDVHIQNIGVYIESGNGPRQLPPEYIAVRDKVVRAKERLMGTWLVAVSGVFVFIVGFMFTWPLGALMSIHTLGRTKEALLAAQEFGDAKLTTQAEKANQLASLTVTVMWGVLLLGACIAMMFASSNS